MILELDELLESFGRVAHAAFGAEPADRADAVLVALRDAGGGNCELWMLGTGEAVALAEHADPPADCVALALVATGWSAPLDAITAPPSRHPDRVRVTVTTVIGGTGSLLSLLSRPGDPGPCVLRDGEGRIPDVLRRIWSRHLHPSSRPLRAT
jgi:hypothetical protein